MKRIIIETAIITSIFIIRSLSAYAAENSGNRLFTSFDKNINVNNFVSDLFGKTEIGNVEFLLGNKFTSTVVRSSSDIGYKDDDVLNLRIARNIGKEFKYGLTTDFLFNQDSKSVRNNEFYDVAVMPFFEFSGADNELISFSAGEKYNKKINVESKGFTWAVSAVAKDWKTGDYTINGSVSDRNIYYGDSRTNGNLAADLSLAADYGDDDEVVLGLNYKKNSIDFLNFIGSSYSRWLYELNTDKNFTGAIKVRYKPADLFRLTSDLEYSMRYRDRNYNKQDDEVANSAFGKTSSYASYKMLNNFYLDLGRLHSEVGVNIYGTEESFNAYAKSGHFSYAQLQNYQNTQKLNDYSFTRFEINYAGNLAIGRRDTLTLNMDASIMQYDTPSDDENDEHDESGSFIGVGFKKHFSENFAWLISGEVKNRHYVYLKAENSSQSNAVKTIMLNQEFELRYPKLELRPKIGLLATYHIYDFQKYLASVSSYNFRQISFEDSLTILPESDFYFAFNSICRYNRRGILYWSSFSEKPVTENIEFMNRVMLYNKTGICTFGIGGSIYLLTQNDIETKKNLHKSRVLSPQCEIGIKFSSDIFVFFIGKYDFQKIGNISANVANLNLKTNIAF